MTRLWHAEAMKATSTILLLVATVTLSGCTSEGAPVPSSSATSTPAPTGTATAAQPGSRLPGTCSDLEDAATLSVLAPGYSLSSDTATAALTPWESSYVTAGLHACRWEAAAASPAVSLAVLPGGVANYIPAVPSTEGVSLIDTVGDASWMTCYDHSESSAGFTQCYFEFVVDDYWAGGFYDASVSPIPFADVTAALSSALDAVADHLHDLGEPRPAWTAAQTLAPSASCDAMAANGTVAAALGGSAADYSVSSFGGSEAYSPIYNVLDQQSPALGCTWWRTDGSFQFSAYVVAGGGWAWDVLEQGQRSPVTIPGAEESYLTESGDSRSVRVLFEDSLVEITAYPSDSSSDSRALAAAAALLPLLPLIP